MISLTNTIFNMIFQNCFVFLTFFLITKLAVLKLSNLYKIEIAKFVHMFMHKILPLLFADTFVKVNEVTIRRSKFSNLNNTSLQTQQEFAE